MKGSVSDIAMEVDGAQGEGGGQILRSSLALSLVTGRPLRMRNIRARRRKPGLMRQHLTAVRAAVAVGAARVQGDALRSTSLDFAPQEPRAGEYHFAVGTAGSTSLVLQTVLWPLLLAPGRSRIVLEGGTHNPLAPPFDFLARSLVPLLRTMGAELTVTLERAGFYPAGGGQMVVEIEGGRALAPLRCMSRGSIRRTGAIALISGLPVGIAGRELNVLHERLGWGRSTLKVERLDTPGPGNALLLELEHDGGTTIVTSFGEKGVPAEAVAARAATEVEGFLAAEVPIDAHLADQLLIPLALAGGGSFRTVEPTPHTRTNAALVQRWLPVEIAFEGEGKGAHRIEVHPRGA